MTIGSPTYVPQGVFGFPRSYITHIVAYTNVDNPATFVFNEIRVNSYSFPNIVQYIEFKTEFIPWSSNHYTLNWILAQWYYKTSPFGVHIPYQGRCEFTWDASVDSNVLLITTDSPDHKTYFPVQGAPSGYWMPPYL